MNQIKIINIVVDYLVYLCFIDLAFSIMNGYVRPTLRIGKLPKDCTLRYQHRLPRRHTFVQIGSCGIGRNTHDEPSLP